MELLFWNMGKNDNAALTLECMRGKGVSVSAFAKFRELSYPTSSCVGQIFVWRETAAGMNG